MSPFPHSSTGVSADKPKYAPQVPAGTHSFKIGDATEKVSKSSLNMIELTAVVIDNDALTGKSIKHWVVFIPAGQPGDGINVHFRKTIGVPYGGEDTVDATQWVGKKFVGKVSHETKDGKTFGKIVDIEPYGGKYPEVEPTEESAPF